MLILVDLKLFDRWVQTQDDAACFLSCLTTAFVIFFMFAVYTATAGYLASRWQEEVAYPFIASLPEERYAVVDVTVDPGIHARERGRLYLEDVGDRELTPLSISIRTGDGMATYTGWMAVSMTLEQDEAPYISAKRLPQDLGHGIHAGLCDPVVYLPADLRFPTVR